MKMCIALSDTNGHVPLVSFGVLLRYGTERDGALSEILYILNRQEEM